MQNTFDTTKFYEFFRPEQCEGRIHIIGCGSVGSTIAELISRHGLTNVTLYDFDQVERHNLANQMFRHKDIGRPKAEALRDMLLEISPDMEIKTEAKGYTGQRLSGYVFLCVDNIDLRREIATANRTNQYIKAMFDIRTGLTDAQHYAADWSDDKMVEDFLGGMNYTHEEAMAARPVSACNVSLSVAPTIRVICSYAVANFTNFVKGGGLKKYILMDAFSFVVDIWPLNQTA